ncbi:MAG: LysM peptidoglycan-binding domain-containing protein [Chloroflexi bacterium]|nr:LysM peptidoglycan-binding domain-containing protein [Chloroflexota bacterium]
MMDCVCYDTSKKLLGGLGSILFALILVGYLAAPAALAQSSDGQVYIVQADDTLWKVAEKYLGDGNRFEEIVAATNAKHAADPSFMLIQDPGLIVSGAKLWIPVAGMQPIVPAQSPAPVVAAAVEQTVPSTTGPIGHIAFSFWNNAPNRCTYEINIIDVPACLKDTATCQANRRVFVLNNVSEPALSPDGMRLAFRGWGPLSSQLHPRWDRIARHGRLLGGLAPRLVA